MTVISKAESPEPLAYGRLSNSSNNLYKMPVDLSYLYSSSPPLQQVLADHCRNNLRPSHHLGQRICRIQAVEATVITAGPAPSFLQPGPTHTFAMPKSCLKALRTNSPPRLPKNNSDEFGQTKDDEFFSEDSKPCLRKTLSDPGTKAEKCKKVTFADAHGFALTFVKYMTETSMEPPKWDVLDSMVRDLKLSAKSRAYQSTTGSVEEKPRLVADFQQPVANYVAFKEQLKKSNVCLENIILKEVASINGTIKVRNIAFEKNVCVRVTFDDWNSHSNHEASYVKSAYGNDDFDTFQFNIAVPKSFDPYTQKAQFCIWYETNGAKYWDNNNGVNYVITSNVFSKDGVPKRKSEMREKYSMPNTYCELPSPEFNTWLEWENKGPFY